MNDRQYDEHSYNAIMSIISRTIRKHSANKSLSKQSILRNSMHLHLGIDFGENGSLPNENDKVLLRKWSSSNDSNQSINGPSSFKNGYKNSAFSTMLLQEGKEHNDDSTNIYSNLKEIKTEQNKMDEIDEESEPEIETENDK